VNLLVFNTVGMYHFSGFSTY